MSTDRLYNLLPTLYRVRDSDQGQPLRALLRILEDEIVTIEQDIDQLYDNWFIETCQEWVVPYIADLLGVRGLLKLEDAPQSLRAQVANALAYRRRKGTAVMLEQMARDVTGWPARVVEPQQRLAMTQQMNHIQRWRVRTPVLLGSEQVSPDSPFVRVPLTARISGPRSGPTCLGEIGVHLWRLRAYPVERAAARCLTHSGQYTFDPLGRDAPLFNVPRTETEITQIATETHVPTPLTRDALRSRLREASVEAQGANEEAPIQVWIDGHRVRPEQITVGNLRKSVPTAWTSGDQRPLVIVDPALGRLALVAPQSAAPAVEVSYSYGFSAELGAGPYRRSDSAAVDFRPAWVIAVSRRRQHQDLPIRVVTDLGEAIRRWNLLVRQHTDLAGMIVVLDSTTYSDEAKAPEQEIHLPRQSRLLILAARWTAPIEKSSEASPSTTKVIADPTEEEHFNTALARLRNLTGSDVETLTRALPEIPDARLLSVSGLDLAGFERLRQSLLMRTASVRKTLADRTDALIGKHISERSDRHFTSLEDMASATPKELKGLLYLSDDELAEFCFQLKELVTQLAQLAPERVYPCLDHALVATSSEEEGGSLILEGLLLKSPLTVRGPLRSLRLSSCTIAPEHGLRIEARPLAAAPNQTPVQESAAKQAQGNPGVRAPQRAESALSLELARTICGPIWAAPERPLTLRVTDSIISGFVDAPGARAVVLRSTILPTPAPPPSFVPPAVQSNSAADLPDAPAVGVSIDDLIEEEERSGGTIAHPESDAPQPIAEERTDPNAVGSGVIISDQNCSPAQESGPRGAAVNLAVLDASNALFAVPVRVGRRQEGCVRFSYLAPSSVAPRRFRCAVTEQRPIFTALRPGDPHFAQLDRVGPAALRTAGEDGAELGAFFHLKHSQREAALSSSLEEHLPVSLVIGAAVRPQRRSRVEEGTRDESPPPDLLRFIHFET